MRIGRDGGEAGAMLAEAVLYVALYFVVLALALSALYVTWSSHRSLARVGADIVRVTEAGERWRDDVRAASAPLISRELDDGQELRIPGKDGEIVYRVAAGRVIRLDGDNASELFRVRQSRMALLESERVKGAWVWEVELMTERDREKVRVPPLFSFKAVRRAEL